MFTVKPMAAMAMKAPMMVTGTVVAGTSVARQFCRKTMMTSSTSDGGLVEGLVDLVDRGPGELRSCRRGWRSSGPGGSCLLSSAMAWTTSSATCSALAPGSWKMATPAARPAVEAAELAVGLGAQLDAADVLDAG